MLKCDFYDFSAGVVDLSYIVIDGNEQNLLIVAPVINIRSLALNTKTGLTVQGVNVTIFNSTLSSTATGLTLSRSPWFSNLITSVTISDSTFSATDTGMSVNYQDFLNITNCIFADNDLGINMYNAQSNVRYIIRQSRFVRNVRAVYGSVQADGRLEFSNNVIAESPSTDSFNRLSGIQLYSSMRDTFELKNNVFFNLSNGALRIECSASTDYASTIMIINNTFSNISKTALNLKNVLFSKATIQDNSFSFNSFSGGPSAVDISVWFTSSVSGTPGNTSLSQNKFQRNVGQHIVKFTTAAFSSDLLYPFSNVSSNLFLNNIASESVIFTQYNRLNINQNIFSNPLAGLDLKVAFPSSFQENCTFNWWGSVNEEDIASRIFDNTDDSSLGLVIYEPFLNVSEFTCDSLSGCSGNGLCILPETCECVDGCKDQLALSLPALEFWIATEEDSASDPTSVTAKKTGLVPTVRKLLAMNEGTAATEESALPPTSKSELINQVKRELTPFSDRAVYAIIYIYNFFFIKKEYCL